MQWNNFGDINDPWMKSRDCEQTLIVYLEDVCNNLMSIGWNEWHKANIDDNFVFTITDPVKDGDIMKIYDLEIGDKYFEFENRIECCVTGDDASNVPNMPIAVTNMRFLWLNILVHEPHLYHSKISGLPVLVAAKDIDAGWNEATVIEEIENISYNLGTDGFVKFYCVGEDGEDGVWGCASYKVWNNADWVFLHKNLCGTVSPSGAFRIPEIIKVTIDSKITNVDCDNNEELHECLTGVFIEPYKWKNINELIDLMNEHNSDIKNVNNQLQYIFTMNNSVIAHSMVKPIDKIINEEKGKAQLKGKLDDYIANREHKRRLEVSTLLHHGILYWIMIAEWWCRFDIAHYLWRFIIVVISIWVSIMWIVWEFEMSEIEIILSFLGVPNITNQFLCQLGTNKTRKTKFTMKINSTGPINKQLINGLPFAILAAMIIANSAKYSANGQQQQIMLFVMSVFWIFNKKMRKVFYILFASEFDDENDVDFDHPNYYSNYVRPSMITEMIEETKLATYIVFHCCNCFVCYMVYILVFVFVCTINSMMFIIAF